MNRKPMCRITCCVFILLLLCSASSLASQGAETSPSKGRSIEFTTDEGTWLSVTVSHDGKTVAFDLLGQIYLLPIIGGEARSITDDSGTALNFHPRFSPDGTKIAFISDRSGQENVWVMDADGHNVKQVSNQRQDRMALPAWTSDGRYIIVRRGGDANVRLRADLWLYSIDGGGGIQLTPNDTSASWPSPSPDGRYLYFDVENSKIEDPMHGRYQIRRLDRQTGDVLDITGWDEGRLFGGAALSSGGGCAPEVSPDGLWLAFVRRLPGGTITYKNHKYGPRSALWVQNLITGAERVVMQPITPDSQYRNNIGPVPRYTWMPDGHSLLITEGGKLRRVFIKSGVIETIPFEATVHRNIADQVYVTRRIQDQPLMPRFLRWPRVSPDGSKLLFQAVGRIWVMNLPTGSPKRLTNSTFEDDEYAPSWSPDGKWIAFTSWSDSHLGHVWKIAPEQGKPIQLTESAGEYWNPVWSPDSTKIVYVRGSGATLRGQMLAENLSYEIDWLPSTGGTSHVVTTVNPSPWQTHIVEPSFGPEGRLFYLEHKSPGEDFEFYGHRMFQPNNDLVSIRLDGLDRRTHLRFPFADEATPSPGGQWVAFEEGDNVFLCPLPWPGTNGNPVEIDRRSPKLPIRQLSQSGGSYPHWISNEQLEWGSGQQFFVKNTGTDLVSIYKADLVLTRDIAEGTILLSGGRLLTMGSAGIIESGDILIRNGRIVTLGRHGSFAIPAKAYRIDSRGKTIMPGIIDVHTHLHGDADGIIVQRNWELAANLAYGITTVLDPYAWAQNIFPTAEMIEAGNVVGPRIFSTGPALMGTDAPRWDRADDLDEARHLVERVASYGATTIKIYQPPRRDQRQLLIQAAREIGVMVTSEGDTDHLASISMIMDGQTGFEHGMQVAPVYRDVTEFLGRAHAFYSATPILVGIGPWTQEYFYQESDVWKDKKLQHFTPWRKLEINTRITVHRPETDYPFPLLAQSVADVISAGGFGTVGAHGQQQGIGSHFDIWTYGSAMPPLQALRIATLYGAQMIGVDQDLGSLDAGKIADLIVLNSNPLDNIRNSQDIKYVMKSGHLYDGDTLDQLWPTKKLFGEFLWQQEEARSVQ